MKTKISVLPLAKCLIFGVVFALCFTTCYNFDDDPRNIFINSLSDAEEKLTALVILG